MTSPITKRSVCLLIILFCLVTAVPAVAAEPALIPTEPAEVQESVPEPAITVEKVTGDEYASLLSFVDRSGGIGPNQPPQLNLPSLSELPFNAAEAVNTARYESQLNALQTASSSSLQTREGPSLRGDIQNNDEFSTAPSESVNVAITGTLGEAGGSADGLRKDWVDVYKISCDGTALDGKAMGLDFMWNSLSSTNPYVEELETTGNIYGDLIYVGLITDLGFFGANYLVNHVMSTGQPSVLFPKMDMTGGYFTGSFFHSTVDCYIILQGLELPLTQSEMAEEPGGIISYSFTIQSSRSDISGAPWDGKVDDNVYDTTVTQDGLNFILTGKINHTSDPCDFYKIPLDDIPAGYNVNATIKCTMSNSFNKVAHIMSGSYQLLTLGNCIALYEVPDNPGNFDAEFTYFTDGAYHTDIENGATFELQCQNRPMYIGVYCNQTVEIFDENLGEYTMETGREEFFYPGYCVCYLLTSVTKRFPSGKSLTL